MADEEPTTKKSTAKKTPAKRAPAKKSPTKRTSATKSSTRKTAPRQTSATKSSSDDSGSERTASMSSEPSPKRGRASRVIAEVSRQFTEMSSKQVEGVTGLERTDDGWRVELDVLELRRIPATTDVLARYEVDADDSGEVEGYRRLQRFVRGQAEATS